MIIRTVDLEENFSGEIKAEITELITRVGEAISEGDYADVSMLNALRHSYVTLTFVTPEYIREVNSEQRGIDKVTDCLSFPQIDMRNGACISKIEPSDYEYDDDMNPVLNLGDVLINLEAAGQQSETYGHSFERETAFLAAHSVLHLLGYDHIDEADEKIMIMQQRKIMAQVGLAFDDEIDSIADLCNHSDEAADKAADNHLLHDEAFPAGTLCRHCGYVALLGRPNVGKSTLVNAITGMKVAIVSHKPQTTRTNIRTIYNTEDTQIIFVDTPGVHNPDSKMSRIMVDKSFKSAINADIVLFMADGRFGKAGSVEKRLLELCRENSKKAVLVISKDDEVKGDELLPVIQSYAGLYDFADVVPISAKNGHNIDVLLKVLSGLLPEGPRLFASDYLTDQTEREIARELIREQVLHYTDQEVPHGIAVSINKFDEKMNEQSTDEYDRKLVVIEADIICERDSHKGIIIGRNGQMIKRIGTAARNQIENLLGCKVYLELYVKVREDWKNNDSVLRDLGLNADKED